MKKNVIFAMVFLAISCFACENGGGSKTVAANSSSSHDLDSEQKAKSEKNGKKQMLNIVCWNVQTFFDGVEDGTEYSEFRGSKSKWNEKAYEARLSQLCSQIVNFNADVYVFEEVENASVLYDISNRLAGKSWSKKDSWDYAAFSKNEGDAIGLAVLSRYPLSALTNHNIDIWTDGEQAKLRPIMKVSVLVGERELVLFVNHWKSKSGGEEKTEVWRNWQEHQLSTLMGKTESEAAIACGDFNRDIFEFQRGSRACNVSFRSVFGKNIEMRSAWFVENGDVLPSYSYFFNGTGERIDHLFLAKDASLVSFAVENCGEWADEEGKPLRYVVHTGEGYSDHLPLSFTVAF